MKYFANVINKNEEIEYRHGVYWLKFYIPINRIKNFNIIPVGIEKEAPDFFKEVIKNLKEYKKLTKNSREN